MMMETVAQVIPQNVYEYVHAVDGRVDMSAEIDGDFSPDYVSSASYYSAHTPATLMNGVVDPNQMAQYAPEYEDPNAGGDHVEYSGAEVYEGTPEAPEYQEGTIYHDADGKPYAYDAASAQLYYLDQAADAASTQDGSAGVVAEGAEVQYAEPAAEEAAGAQYVEAAVAEEVAAAYADPAQAQADETAYEAAPEEAAQGYYDENGQFVYYEQAAQVEEAVYSADQQLEATPEYAADAAATYPQDGYVDPTHYSEQSAVEGVVYTEGSTEYMGAENVQVDPAYTDPNYTYATAEGVETELAPEAPAQPQESQVAPPAADPVPVDEPYDQKEHQREMDLAFLGPEQANRLFQEEASQVQAVEPPEQQPIVQDPTQDYGEVPAAEQVTYEGQEVEYAVPDGTEAYAYDPAQQTPEVYNQEVPADQAASSEYYQGEVAVADGSEVPATYEGEASQVEYQDPNADQLPVYEHQYIDADGNPASYLSYDPYPATSEAAVDETAVYVDPSTETAATAEAQANAEIEYAQQEPETAQESVEATGETQEYAQYDQQGVVSGDATYYEGEAVADPNQQAYYPQDAAADPSQLGQYTEEVAQGYTEVYTEEYPAAPAADDGTMPADPAYSAGAAEAQQYGAEYYAEGQLVDGAQPVETYGADQGYVAEDGSVVQAPAEYAAGDVAYAEEQCAQVDQGYSSEPANDSAECVVETPEQQQQQATEEYQGQTGELVYDEATQQYYSQETGEIYYLPEEQYIPENAEQQYYTPEQSCIQENGQEYVEATQQEYVEGDVQPGAECYEQQYTAEEIQAYAEQHPELVQEEYVATEAPIEYQVQQEVAQPQAVEPVAELSDGTSAQEPQVYPQEVALTNGVHHPQENGEVHQEKKPGVPPIIVRAKPFTPEMDSTEKFKNFRIEYERTPAFDAFGHCLKFLGVRKGFVCSIHSDGVVSMQLKGTQQDQWQDTEFEYDASKPAEKVEVGKMYIIAHAYEGSIYMERCRVKTVNDDSATINLIDSGYERNIARSELYDIINLEEVERLPAQELQVVDIFVVGLTFQGYSKEDLRQLEREWSAYEEVFIIPVDAPPNGLLRTIVCRKTGETLGIRVVPQIARKGE